MPNTVGRRAFLKTAGAGVLTGAGLGVLGSPLAHAATPDSASEYSRMPRLLVGLCAYSYREQLTHGGMTLEDFIQKAVELDVDAVDMTVYYLKSTEPAYLDHLRYLAYKSALPFSGTACKASMVQADAAGRAECVSEIKKWVDVTDRLGASHLRVFAGTLPAGLTLPQAVDSVVEVMKAGCDYSAQKGILLGLEDHSGVSQSADVCVEIIRRVNSPYAGINLDITHFVPSPTQDSYAQIAACLPYATMTHIRDRFDDKTTPVDMERVWRLFAQAAYKGYMSVEYDAAWNGGESAVTGVPKLIAKTRELCRKYSSVQNSSKAI
jgi:sugar phosphate isomerase/epimerase